MTRHVLMGIGALALVAPADANAQPAAATPSVEAVLAANHSAVGAATGRGTLRLNYAYQAAGLTGTQTQTQDLASGAFIDSYELGPTGGATGFDGKTPWMRDQSGANTTQEGGDRVAVAVNEAYRAANLWWRPDRGGAQVAYVGRETLDGKALDHLTVPPRGGLRFDAWFDAGTHLLDRIAEDEMFLHTRLLYADYRREGGRREGGAMLAHKITIDGGEGEASYETLTLTGARVGAAQPLSAYSRPTAPPTGAAIDGGAASATVPFRLLNNHIYVQATVNGKGPYTFIVDTGGHTILSHRVVQEAGLDSQGKGAEGGAGEGSSTLGYAKVHEIAVGPVRMTDQTGFTTEIYEPAIEGIRVDGMVGFELFRRFAVRIDYAAQTLTFTDFARFSPAGAGTEIPFRFYDHVPQVTGKIGDLPARLDIDTGSRSELDITSPTVARAGLRALYPKSVNAVTGWGVGGPSHSDVARLPSLTLGGVTSDSVVGEFSNDHGGSFSDPNFEGNVGSGFLKRYVVTFDYAHQRMYLKPIDPAPQDAGRFDRSGMWINAGADGYAVTFVNEGGAAAGAGLAVGDVITSLDGKPAVAAELSDARSLLRARPAGTHVPLEFKRGAETKQAELVLKDQI